MITGFAAFIIGLFVLYGTYLYFYQEKLIFFPSREMVMTPDEVNLIWEDIWIEVAPGERINGWFVKASDKAECDSETKTILFCHGNAGNISRRVYTIQFLSELGVNVFMFDYRGYGRSDGSPSEQNVYTDARAAYDWLRQSKKVPAEQIYVFGRSLGGAVAIELAGAVPTAGLIVESAFTSAVDMGRRMYPFMPVGMLTRFKFDSISKIGKLNCPILVTHSPVDELIPYEMGQRLYRAAKSDKRFIDLAGSHNERISYDNDHYIKGLRRFLECGEDGSDMPDVNNSDL